MSGRQRPKGRPRAFATLTAIGLIVVVGVALTALTALLARDVKRSLRASDDAQLRQLLIAGEVAARASLDRPEPAAADVAVPLPADLAAAGFAIRVARLPSDGANDDPRFTLLASRADGRSMTQALRYSRTGEHWQLASAERD